MHACLDSSLGLIEIMMASLDSRVLGRNVENMNNHVL